MIREGCTEKGEFELATEGSREDRDYNFFLSFSYFLFGPFLILDPLALRTSPHNAGQGADCRSLLFPGPGLLGSAWVQLMQGFSTN